MKNYDGHETTKHADELSNQNKTDVTARDSEKLINIGFHCLSVKDSFSFITASFDKLVSLTKYDNTDEENRSKWISKENWQNNSRDSRKNETIKTEKCFDLLTEKGVYPYDYMNSMIDLKMKFYKTKTNMETL